MCKLVVYLVNWCDDFDQFIITSIYHCLHIVTEFKTFYIFWQHPASSFSPIVSSTPTDTFGKTQSEAYTIH